MGVLSRSVGSSRSFGVLFASSSSFRYSQNFEECLRRPSSGNDSHGSNWPLFRLMDTNSAVQGDWAKRIRAKDSIFGSDEACVKMLSTMLTSHVLDTYLYEVQRQGRISFYMQNHGEEGLQVGSASGLSMDDVIWPQYRELGVYLYRGLTVKEVTDQCFSNANDPGKGRQMPVHYLLKPGQGNIHVVTTPLCTQLGQAAGAGYSYAIDKKPIVAATYFGEGAASEGDFATSLNFAATLGSQCMFLCRNNGYAISTPACEQYNKDSGVSIAHRGVAYGMPSIRVDGNDILASHFATKFMREISIKERTPVFIEYMSYRLGHHSTSDDSSRYRNQSEIDENSKPGIEPISRFEKLLVGLGVVKSDFASGTKNKLKEQVLASIKTSEVHKKAAVEHMFTHVYETMPWHLKEQYQAVKDHVKRHPEVYKAELERFENGEQMLK